MFLNWESIRDGQTYHERFDPYGWAGRCERGFNPDAFPATLDILARTCRVRLFPELPVSANRMLGRRLARYRIAAA